MTGAEGMWRLGKRPGQRMTKIIFSNEGTGCGINLNVKEKEKYRLYKRGKNPAATHGEISTFEVQALKLMKLIITSSFFKVLTFGVPVHR